MEKKKEKVLRRDNPTPERHDVEKLDPGKKKIKIMGLELPMFLIVAGVIVAACALGIMPTGMAGAFLFLMIFGELLNKIGNVTPIIKTFLGGGAIVCIFGGAALVYWHVIPTVVTENCTTFMTTGGFLDFYIAALITGSILGMDRHLLIKAAIRYLPCLIGAVGLALILVAAIGHLFGMAAGESVAYIGIPIMGGGMGAGAVPISKVFESALGIPASHIMSRLVPAVALGNAFAIITGGLLDKLGHAVPSLSGNGELVRREGALMKPDDTTHEAKGIGDYATGMVVAMTFFAFGSVVAKLVGFSGLEIHPYAWMIIAVAVAKCTNIIPEKYEKAAAVWYDFVAKNWTCALMLGIGIAYTDMGQIIAALNPEYIILVAVVVLGAVLGAGLMGRLVGFYPIEAAITAGLCMANMGGTGDVAVLMASKRMELMPFAQISSRLGGALIILMASVLVPIFF
jgi:Na+/citrate or Na+/malate symporter